jgi:hypothetical protein
VCPDKPDLEDIKHVIRAARQLGMMACDNADLVDRPPHTFVERDGSEIVSPHGAVELSFCEGGTCNHDTSAGVLAFLYELRRLHEFMFHLRKYGDPRGQLAGLEAQWAHLLRPIPACRPDRAPRDARRG